METQTLWFVFYLFFNPPLLGPKWKLRTRDKDRVGTEGTEARADTRRGVTVHRTLIKVATAYQINKYKRGGGVHASASLEAGSKILGWEE